MLEKTGFSGITLFGNFSDTTPKDWEGYIVFKGTKWNAGSQGEPAENKHVHRTHTSRH